MLKTFKMKIHGKYKLLFWNGFPYVDFMEGS